MQGFLIDLIFAFGAAFLILFIPVIFYKQSTKTALPRGLQKNIAIIAGVISLIIVLKKYFG